MSKANAVGKLKRTLKETCPNCLTVRLQLRRIDSGDISFCPSCGYIDKNDVRGGNRGHKKRERITDIVRE